MTECILCDNEAEFFIKGTSNGYCKDCAEDSFGDISYLVKAETQAKALKDATKERLSEE